MPGPFTLAIIGFEFALLLAGAVLCVRLGLSQRRTPPALAAWNVPLSDFLNFLLYVIGGWLVGGMGSLLAATSFGLKGQALHVFAGGGQPIGLLAGAAVGLRQFRGAAAPDAPPVGPAPGVFVSGVVTFLISLPIILVLSLTWRLLLRLVGLPTERQELVDLFARPDSSLILGVLIILATIVAPIGEELAFRAGFFRFLRTRVSRWLALLAPAVLFAVVHGNFAGFAPLLALAVIFSLAYERTGQIGTSIVAHALFNLNTIMLVFSGIDKLT